MIERVGRTTKKIVPRGLDCLLKQLSPGSYIPLLECAMTAECLSIKKKELIKTIRTNYFNQSKKKKKGKGRETIMALETTTLRKLSLSELNVFSGW